MALPQSAILDQEKHINDNKKPSLIVASATCLSAAYIAVILRFTARRLARNSLEADDYTVLVALFFTSVFVTTVLLGVHYGLGRHLILVTDGAAFGKVVLFRALQYPHPLSDPFPADRSFLPQRYFTTPLLRPPSSRSCSCTDVSSPFEDSLLFSGVLGPLLRRTALPQPW